MLTNVTEEPASSTDVWRQRGNVLLKVTYLCGLLYCFLFGLELMGSSFKLLGGRSAGDAFSAVDNPIAGLMVGILATVLVQSSSTSTSIVVSLVGSKIISVEQGIPIIMGANIGTSVTNTLVSLTHVQKIEEFERAFGGATVHDFFNFLSVLVLLPLEIVTGMFRHLSGVLTTALTGGSGSDWEGPIKKIVAPLAKKIFEVDKSKIKAIAKGKEVEGSLIKKGFFANSSLSDGAVGGICLAVSLIILCVGLILLVRFLKSVLETRVGGWLKRALHVNALFSMIMGMGITILVQSSSVTTSALVPLVAVGTVDLEHLFPITLGANVGTTVTALLASMTQDSANALQIALVHLCFNLAGILIWFPAPFMRKVPLAMARQLGVEVARKRWVALVYVLVVFLVIPLNILGFSEASAPWLFWFGLALNIVVPSGFIFVVWVRRNRPAWIPCAILRIDAEMDRCEAEKEKDTQEMEAVPDRKKARGKAWKPKLNLDFAPHAGAYSSVRSSDSPLSANISPSPDHSPDARKLFIAASTSPSGSPSSSESSDSE